VPVLPAFSGDSGVTEPRNLRIGYALGGGGARGLSHIGVLKVLEAEGIRPDVIAGTSIGALVGALYASGLTPDDLERLALSLNRRQLTMFLDLTFPFSGLIQGKRVTSAVESLVGKMVFADLKVPLACVATDLNTGKAVVIRKGSVAEAVRASIAIPGIMTPALFGNRWLVDGGIVSEVPAGVCRRMGADYVIGVNVIPDPARVVQRLESLRESTLPLAAAEQKRNVKRLKPPRVIDIMVQTLLISCYRVAMQNLKGTDLAISPDLASIGFWDFHKASEAIAHGEAAAWAALKQARNIPSRQVHLRKAVR